MFHKLLGKKKSSDQKNKSLAHNIKTLAPTPANQLLPDQVNQFSDFITFPSDHLPLMTVNAPIGKINAITFNIMAKMGPYGFALKPDESKNPNEQALFNLIACDID